MIRTILSPGIELKEVDKSYYVPTVGTVDRALIMGFADKGPLQTPTQITSMVDFQNTYGYPTNEAERYFYNAADIMLGSGGVVIAARIPYEGDLEYVGQSYTIGTALETKGTDSLQVDLNALSDLDARDDDLLVNTDKPDYSKELSAAFNVDKTITKFVQITQENTPVALDIEKFNKLDNGDRTQLEDSAFYIIDKSRGLYKTYTNSGSNVDCLGIMPVVTTAANALAIAYQLNGVNMDSSVNSEISDIVNVFESINGIQYISNLTETTPSCDDTQINNAWEVYANTRPGANTLNSISKNAATFFPTVNYATNVVTGEGEANLFDRSYFSYIGIVVYKIKVDKGTGNLYADPIEAYAGSLFKDAKDLRTNASIFIEDIVNTTSKTIGIYVNSDIAQNKPMGVKAVGDQTLLDSSSILWVEPATATILGVPKASTNKKISFKLISTTMDNVFNSYSNILANTLDVVVDGGLSTIAQAVWDSGDEGEIFDPDSDPTIEDGPWQSWRAIVNKMKKFCETTRKDCTFVCDSPRGFSLVGKNKRVSDNDLTKNVANTILPNIKHISGVNTSYGWGYAIWYKIGDAYSGQGFWCPPSIFGANRYINTRTRYNVWDAPAGMTRGVISIDDTSFEPDLNARNTLYSNAWNYSLTYNQRGITCLEGQKTFQSKTSAFDRINVRSLFLSLERQIFQIAQNYLYEPNTAETRQNFVDNVEPIFSSIKSQGGCYAYKIICDESINTPQRIDNNELHIRFGVQPTKTIEFIMCEFVAVRTGSNWSELVEE